MSLLNQPPGFFQSVTNIATKYPNIATSLDSKWAKPNQQYREFGLTTKDTASKNMKSYAYDVLRGIQEVSLFSLLFFSYENIQEIQKLIKYNVFNIMKARINNQSETELIVIMRAVYLEHSVIPSEQQMYTQEIAKLNEIVIDQAVRIILSEISQQQKYLYDIKNNPYLKEYGVNDNVAGTKELRAPSDVILGL
jgi:hypothetical protein